MYAELYAAWQSEVENPDLQPLASDFFVRVADYVRRIREETRMLDKKTVKATLMDDEMRNVKRMVKELVQTRRRKLIKLISEGERLPSGLTAEEEKIYTSFLNFTETSRGFAKSLLQGNTLKTEATATAPHKRVTLRFKKAIPSVIGVDMKPYGPFLAEDVASVPLENAKLLVKQGLAEIVEVS